MDLRPPVPVQFGNAEFDQLTGTLKRQGQEYRLRPQTSAVLAYLLSHPGQIVSKNDLHEAVWSDTVVTENSLTQCISEIRRALGGSADTLLETVPRRGYVIRAVASVASSAVNSLYADADTTDKAATRKADAPAVAAASRGFPAVRKTTWWKLSGAGLLLSLSLVLVFTGVLWRNSATPPPSLTLAVLPFEAKSQDADLAWFGDVVGEDLTFNLSRIPGTHVVSRVSTQAYPATGMDVRAIGQQLGVRYLVGGSLRREGGQILLNLHLADTQTGQQQWAERFTTSVADLPRTEHWAAQRIAQSLHLELINEFAQQTAQMTAPQLDAQTLALQAWAAWNRDTPQDAARAKALALQALAIDDRSVLALKTLASWHLRARINQSMPDDEALDGAESFARHAMAVDPGHPLVHTVLGGALTLRGQYEQGARLLVHEIETNPSHPVAHYFLGLAYLMQGQPDEAARVYEQLIRISPRDTRLSRYYRNLAMAYLHLGQMKPALQFARAATETPQPFPNAWAALGSVCALSGDTACSQAALGKFLAIRPGFDIQRLEAEWPPATGTGFTAQHARYVSGLRLAGLPDKAPRP